MVVMQPIASHLVRRFAKLGVDPLWLVTAHSLMGLTAAVLLASVPPAERSILLAPWIFAALLLLAKALLDNVDGGLARATDRVTRMGRYYDTGMDLIVNAALFAAIARHTGAPLALAGFVAATLVLSLDFNMERLYRAVRDEDRREVKDARSPRGAPIALFALFQTLYAVVLAPQDRAIEQADRALFQRVDGRPYRSAPKSRKLAWSDLFSTAALVDLGLTTQTVLLAALLLMGQPGWFPWCCLAGLFWALGVQVRRIGRYRAYRQRMETPRA